MTLVTTSDNSPSQNHSIVITMLTNSIYTLMSEWVTHLQVGKKSFQVKKKAAKKIRWLARRAELWQYFSCVLLPGFRALATIWFF